MSNIVAKALQINDRVVPIPFDFVPSQIQSSDVQDIIVAIQPQYKNHTMPLQQKVFKYYGKENVSIIFGKLPSLDEQQVIYCVSISCILNKINADRFTIEDIPDIEISPLWTEERFSISAEEAVIAFEMDEKIYKEIAKRRIKYTQKLNDLEIKMDSTALSTIKDCRALIQEASNCEAKASKNCRLWAAKSVAKFLNENFPVEARVETLVEPVVVFIVKNDLPDEEATIIGHAIDIVFNSIDPIASERFFSEFLYDACSWPVIIDETFDYRPFKN